MAVVGRVERRAVERLAAGFVCLVLAAGCGVPPNGRPWGEDTTAVPGWDSVGRAAFRAAVEPETWLPLVGAIVVGLSGGDRNLSGWARDHTPVFGSRDEAAQASDDLPVALGAACVLSALAAPGGHEPRDWVPNKLKVGLVDAGAVIVNGGATATGKWATKRERPDGSDLESFPSGHASGAGVLVALTSRNLDQSVSSGCARVGLRIGLDALAVATSWARVEAGKHYPSDVLVGVALGHFIGALMSDAFLGRGAPARLTLAIAPDGDGTGVGVSWAF